MCVWFVVVEITSKYKWLMLCLSWVFCDGKVIRRFKDKGCIFEKIGVWVIFFTWVVYLVVFLFVRYC